MVYEKPLVVETTNREDVVPLNEGIGGDGNSATEKCRIDVGLRGASMRVRCSGEVFAMHFSSVKVNDGSVVNEELEGESGAGWVATVGE